LREIGLKSIWKVLGFSYSPMETRIKAILNMISQKGKVGILGKLENDTRVAGQMESVTGKEFELEGLARHLMVIGIWE
jgi:hypothetical protein